MKGLVPGARVSPPVFLPVRSRVTVGFMRVGFEGDVNPLIEIQCHLCNSSFEVICSRNNRTSGILPQVTNGNDRTGWKSFVGLNHFLQTAQAGGCRRLERTLVQGRPGDDDGKIEHHTEHSEGDEDVRDGGVDGPRVWAEPAGEEEEGQLKHNRLS